MSLYRLFTITALCIFSGASLHAEVVIDLNAGYLRNASGMAFVPSTGNGGLLELVSSHSGTFSLPTSSSFVTGDNVLVASFGMDDFGKFTFDGSTFSSPGWTQNQVSFNLSNTGSNQVAVGDLLALRWFPTVTYNGDGNAANSPAPAGTQFGQFRSNTGERGGLAWIVPSDGNEISLVFNTPQAYASSTHQESDGFASLLVGAGPTVPEPSTYALLGLGFGGLAFGAMQQRRRRQVLV